jgi:hypothetical protein
MTENKVPYEVAEVDRPLTREGETVPVRTVGPSYGIFRVRNYTGVTQVTDRFDSESKYVSVFATVGGRAQLGLSYDTGGSLPIVANTGITLPAQAARAITVALSSSGNVTIVWHDDPLRIWG